MGSGSSRKEPPVVTRCRAPVYAVRRIGNRHLVLAGGGGAAATGVTNQIETLILSMEMDPVRSTKVPLMANVATQLRTDPRATMNMDVVSTSSAEQGRYLIACGQDNYCYLYETLGFGVTADDGSPKQPTFEWREVGRVNADLSNDGYTKSCCLDHSTQGKWLITGGGDGYIRVWSTRDLLEHRDPSLKRKPEVEIQAHTGPVDHVNVSSDGRFILSVGDGAAKMWDLRLGTLVTTLTLPPGLANGFRVRSAQFTPLGDRNLVIIVGINQVVRNKNSMAHVALYVFNRDSSTMRPILIKDIGKGTNISTMNISQDGSLLGVGTMEGDVIVLDMHELKPLLKVPQTHSIFVTGIEFLDQKASDVVLPREFALNGALPGPASCHRASLVSLSADQTMQVHNVPYTTSTPFSISLLHISLISLLVYVLVWSVSLVI